MRADPAVPVKLQYNTLRLLRNRNKGVKEGELEIILKYSLIKALEGMLVK
jgi:hypothetical protein